MQMRVLIINRSANEFCQFTRYIDHLQHDVAYVTVQDHVGYVPRSARCVEIIHKLAAPEHVWDAALVCAHALGGMDRVLTLTEIDQLTAAALREEFGASGSSLELTTRFRDKVVMKQALLQGGIRVPQYRPVSTVTEVTEFAVQLGAAVIVKPRKGVASGGCQIVDSPERAPADLLGIPMTEYEVEEYIPGPIWHADGLVVEGDLHFALASRYIGTCYEFARGNPLGTVTQVGEAADELCAFAFRCVNALGLRDGAFHLEAIKSASGFVFMEVAARVGGSYLPYLFRDVYGFDLVAEWIRLQLNEFKADHARPGGAGVGGGLVVPEAVGSRVAARRSMIGAIPELYREMLPPVGHFFRGHGEYEDVLGTFLFVSETPRLVEEAIRRTMNEYHYTLEPASELQLAGTN
jgi:biotin carboxylase